MISQQFETRVKSVPGLDIQGRKIKKTLHNTVLAGGEPVRTVVDVLHGTWLGHPLHPVLTDVTIGAWLLGAFFDGLAVQKGSRHLEEAADTLIGLGTVTAVPTAIAGIADYSTISNRAVSTGLLHGLLNLLGFSMYLVSLASRKRGNRGAGTIFSMVGLALVTLSAWIGGHLVYKQRIGVNHTHPATEPKEWQAVLPEMELGESEARRIEVAGNPVLLYRYGGTVYAISAVCSHAGGPLEEGQFEGFCVQCPWHDSVFDLRDGSIVHGPATFNQPAYRTRIYNGQIEIRAN